jgi:hypothetical protein
LTPKERRAVSRSLRKAAAHAVLLAPLFLLGCSALSLSKEDAPVSGPDSAYSTLVADHIKASFKDYASYDAFEISDFRWVHSVKGWSWLTCVRFKNKERQLSYALFIKDKQIVEYRYAVVTDGCNTQTYSPFAPLSGTKTLATGTALEPLY